MLRISFIGSALSSADAACANTACLGLTIVYVSPSILNGARSALASFRGPAVVISGTAIAALGVLLIGAVALSWLVPRIFRAGVRPSG